MDKRGNIIALAKAQLGIKESPAGSNIQKYGQWYQMNGVAWCAISVSWIYSQAGSPLGFIDTEKGFHYCPSGYNYFKRTKQLTKTPQKADLVFYNWQMGKAGDNLLADHVGIFDSWELDENKKPTGKFLAYEGNTSIGNDSNGGEFMLRVRDPFYVLAFVSPKVLLS